MDLTEIFRALRRRWYVAVVGLLATAGLCFAAFNAVPPSYEARGHLLLLPPDGLLEEGANPFLFLGGLEQPAEIVSTYLDGDAPRAQVATVAPTADYTVEVDTTTNGPVLAVVVEDVTPQGAVTALQTVLDAIPAGLRDLERSLDVPDGSSIGSMTLAADTEATTITKGSLRAVTAAAGAGVLATGLSVAALDALLSRRAARREDSEGDDGTGPDAEDRNGTTDERDRDRLARHAGVESRPPLARPVRTP